MIQSEDPNPGTPEIFVCIRYGEQPWRELFLAIQDVSKQYGFIAHIASERWFEPDLWPNTEQHLRVCRYAIVVIDVGDGQEISPNVALEAGYLLAMGKAFLILREKQCTTTMVNLEAKLYRSFDYWNITGTVKPAVSSWLESHGHRILHPSETIGGSNRAEAQRRRTGEIIEALRQCRPQECVRQAGSLSSLAISDKERTLMQDSDLRTLLLEEKTQMEAALNRGVTIRCLICPFIQVMCVQLGVLSPDAAETDGLPRIAEMCNVLRKYIDRHQDLLQVAVTPRLPHDNVFIDCKAVYIGHRRLREWGFPQTDIRYDQATVQFEISLFDEAFKDAVSAAIGRPVEALREPDFGSDELKLKVIAHWESCESQLKVAIKERRELRRLPIR